MIWKSKYPPIYVFEDDFWFCEKDGKIHAPDFQQQKWSNGCIFPDNCNVIMGIYDNKLIYDVNVC